jgi:hypothetical protein
MKIATIAVAALSLAFLAACDRGEPRPKTASPAASGSSATPQAQTPMSSDNAGKTELNPVQGQVDPKQGTQHKDFQSGGK